MVIASEKAPHGDSASARTTTRASTASRMTMMESTAISAAAPPTGPISSLRHLPERLAVAPHGEEQRRHVLHRAGEDDADDDPDGPWQEPHLGRQHRPDERSRPGYRREVVPEEHPPVHRLEVPTVVEPLGGRGPRVVRPEHLVPG